MVSSECRQRGNNEVAATSKTKDQGSGSAVVTKAYLDRMVSNATSIRYTDVLCTCEVCCVLKKRDVDVFLFSWKEFDETISFLSRLFNT